MIKFIIYGEGKIKAVSEDQFESFKQSLSELDQKTMQVLECSQEAYLEILKEVWEEIN